MKLTFINGALLAAILEGGAIIKEEYDGYDHHVLLKHGGEAPEFKHGFYHTKNYGEGSNEFVLAASHNCKRVTEAIFLLDNEVAGERVHKAKYPKQESKLAAIPEGFIKRELDFGDEASDMNN